MTTFRRLASYARPHRGGVAGVTLLTSLSVAFSVLRPWPLKLLVDNVIPGQPLPSGAAWLENLPGADDQSGLVVWLVGITVLLALLAATAVIVQRYVLTGISTRMMVSLGRDVFDHLQALSLGYHRRARAGDQVRRVIEDTNSAREFVSGVMVPIGSSALSLVVVSIVMFALDPLLTVVALAAALPIIAAVRRFADPMTEHAYQQYELEGEMMAVAEQTLTALPVVQAFGREEHGTEQFYALSHRTVRAFVRSTVAQLQFTVSTGVVIAVGTAVVMAVGGLQVIKGSLTLGGLLVFLSYLATLYAPLETLALVGRSYAIAAAGARRVFQVLDTPITVADGAGAHALPPARHRSVGIERVTFGYEADRRTLRDVTLQVPPGGRLAIVGETGSGKSTLLSLLTRSADPWSGRITIDGEDVRDLSLDSLRSEISIVLQEPFLLPLTIAENIAYGRPEATRAQVEAAARAAQADTFIQRLPKGYDTVVGERGSTLSGGERQRVAIARALLKDAPILLLDEPTAAVDAETEDGLLDALDELMVGRTTILVTHRLSALRGVDVVAVMDQGEIVEIGRPQELLRAGGLFADFYELQFGLLPEVRPEMLPGHPVEETHAVTGAKRPAPDPLTIVLVSQEYPPDTAHGGIASQTYLKAHGLAALGHRVHVVSHSIDDDRHDLTDGPVTVTRLPGVYDAAARDPEAARWVTWSEQVGSELDALCGRLDVDVIDAPEWGAELYSFLLNRVRAPRRTPVALHLQGPLAMLAAELGWPERSTPLFDMGSHMEKSCLRLADAVYSSSRCSAEWVERAYGVDASTIPVAHVGVDIKLFRPPAARPADPTIVFVGRLSEAKGALDLVDAALEVAPDHPGLRLRMVGRDEGGLSAELERRARVAGFPDLLVLVGPKRREDLPRELGQAHLFAAPSHYEGGPGFVYLEAMACGLPVIACSGSGASEVVVPDHNGILVPPRVPDLLAKALERLLSNAAEREAMGRRARAWVEQNADRERCIARIESLLRQVARGDRW